MFRDTFPKKNSFSATKAAKFIGRRGDPGAEKRLLAGSLPLAGLDPYPEEVRLKRGPDAGK